MLGSALRQALRGTAGQLRPAAADWQATFSSLESTLAPLQERVLQPLLASGSKAAFSAATPKFAEKGGGADSGGHSGRSTVQGDTAEADTLAAAQHTARPAAEGDQAPDAATSHDTHAQSIEQLEQQLLQRDAMLLEKDSQIEEVQERSLRALADLENIRERSARQAETTRKFAVQGFAKALLEVADNLERALEIAPDEAEEPSADRAITQLKSLRDGLQLTDKVLLQVFRQNGLVRYEALGEKFDPNLHNALFEVPDPSKAPGTVAIVTKAGYRLHDRVLRPAEVGVVQAHTVSTNAES